MYLILLLVKYRSEFIKLILPLKRKSYIESLQIYTDFFMTCYLF